MSISHQFVSLVVLFGSGIFFGAILDMFRIGLKNGPLKLRMYQYPLEIVLWITFGIASFFLIYFVKFGVWRYVDPVAQWMGIITYSLYLKGISRFFGRVLYQIIIRPILWCIFLIFAVIRFIIRIVFNFFMFFLNPIKKMIGKFCKKYLK